MIRIFNIQSEANTFCQGQNSIHGANYTVVISNALGDQWSVQILMKDYVKLTSVEQSEYTYSHPLGWFDLTI